MTFLHDADLGDIIAALPTIRHLGGGDLIITAQPSPRRYHGREPMTKERFEVIAPLLRYQPYLKSVRFSQTNVKCDVDFTTFRDRHEYFNKLNLAQWQARHAGLDDVDLSPWLYVPGLPAKRDDSVVFARSPRQRPIQNVFPWKEAVDWAGDRAIFVGFDDERKAFEQEFNCRLDHPRTRDLAGLAQLIGSASLCLVNNGLPFWLAIGTGTPVCQETNVRELTGVVTRWNAAYVREVADLKRFYEISQVKNVLGHVVLFVQSYEPRDYDTARRNAFAQSTWADSHRLQVRRFSVSELPRDSSDAGDDRCCPYVKDVFDLCFEHPDSVFAYTNSDVALCPEWLDVMLPHVWANGCAMSKRVDIPRFVRPLNMDIFKNKQPYPGADLFMFTPEWWEEHRDEFPDLILGYEGWDFVMKFMMKRSGFTNVPAVCYHEAHPPFWARSENLIAHPMQKLCRDRAAIWATKRGAAQYLGSGNFLFKGL